MKRNLFLIVFMVLHSACHYHIPERMEITEFPLNQDITLSVMLTDSVILFPEAIFIMNDQLWIFQSKKNPMFDVFNITDGNYLFSAGQKGQGPNDFIFPMGQTIQAGDDFFTILDRTILKTIVSTSNNDLRTVKSQKTFNQSPINGFIKLGDSLFCAFADCAMGTEGKFEYILRNNSNDSEFKFSTYPEFLANKKFNQDKRCQIFYKYLACNPDKRKFAAFYYSYKFIRFYSYDGTLEKEINVNIPPFQIRDVENSAERIIFYGEPIATENYIYVPCRSDKKEIQVWDWDGNPIICYRFDESFAHFTISEVHKKAYLVSLAESALDKIFVFDLLHFPSEQSETEK